MQIDDVRLRSRGPKWISCLSFRRTIMQLTFVVIRSEHGSVVVQYWARGLADGLWRRNIEGSWDWFGLCVFSYQHLTLLGVE